MRDEKGLLFFKVDLHCNYFILRKVNGELKWTFTLHYFLAFYFSHLATFCFVNWHPSIALCWIDLMENLTLPLFCIHYIDCFYLKGLVWQHNKKLFFTITKINKQAISNKNKTKKISLIELEMDGEQWARGRIVDDKDDDDSNKPRTGAPTRDRYMRNTSTGSKFSCHKKKETDGSYYTRLFLRPNVNNINSKSIQYSWRKPMSTPAPAHTSSYSPHFTIKCNEIALTRGGYNNNYKPSHPTDEGEENSLYCTGHETRLRAAKIKLLLSTIHLRQA